MSTIVSRRPFFASLFLCALGLAAGRHAKAEDNWVYEKAGSVPLDAIIGGTEPDGTRLYICRAFFNGGLHPGRVRPGLAGCDIGWGGVEHLVPFYQVLVPRWRSAINGNVPTGAYSYGFEAPDPGNNFIGPALYPCRAFLNGGLHPGKVRPGFTGCYVGWGGKEISVNPYEVLIAGPFNQLPVQNYNLGSGNIPFRLGPVMGGFEVGGQPLYVCLAAFNGGRHPGKTRPALGGCNIGWGGAEQSVPFQNSSVLILSWMQPSQISYLSFQAGNEADGEPLYICNASVNGGFYPGKYSHVFNACSVGLNGSEYMATDFTVLTDNQQIPR
jgi:hypothetical protein